MVFLDITITTTLPPPSPHNPPEIPSPQVSTHVNILKNRGGVEKNNLNNFVKQYLEYDENETFPTSLYYNLNDICAEFQPLKDEFIMVTLNIESLMAKIDKLR